MTRMRTTSLPVLLDDLSVCRDDLAYERGRFDSAARAPYEGRLGDVGEWIAAQDMRRRRIVVLEHRIAERQAVVT